MNADHPEGDRSLAGGLVKVAITLPKVDWHQYAVETLWAMPVDQDRVRLQSVPFYAYGFSYDDMVWAPETGDRRIVTGVSERSGHSTYRIFVTNSQTLQQFPAYWAPLEACGCTLERATERLFAVDVPPEADIYAVYDGLTKGEAAGVWDFEEAHVGHTLRADDR